MVSAQLLTEKPLSGDYPERQYEPSARANTWVRFSDPANAWAPWVGVFGNNGAALYSAVVQFPDSQHALVIAAGQGYIVHAQSGGLVRKTRWSYSYSATAVPGREFHRCRQHDRYLGYRPPWGPLCPNGGISLRPQQGRSHRAANPAHRERLPPCRDGRHRFRHGRYWSADRARLVVGRLVPLSTHV
jgi:hypothetical protein